MFLFDKPYISPFLKQTVCKYGIPVVDTPGTKLMDLDAQTRLICEEQAVESFHTAHMPVYTVSENSIGWLSNKLGPCTLMDHIALFKDKLKFRELTHTLFPDFFFQEVQAEDLTSLAFDSIPLPVVIKPTVGFFSMGVHTISTKADWTQAINAIGAEMEQVKEIYPTEVLNAATFIIEQYISGDEFAVDAYFNADGKPIVLGIFKHLFSSAADVSDRVYITSRAIIETHLQKFTAFLEQIGQLTGVKTFPMHVELRRNHAGQIIPIEVNPMRFGGWCTTADATHMAYGMNPYHYYYTQQEPNWPALLQKKDDSLFSLIVLDNSTGIPSEQISSFDYEKLLSGFSNPLELRKVDHNEYPLFGFLFAETPADSLDELETILHSDLTEFIK